jgi:hypothetical protein
VLPEVENKDEYKNTKLHSFPNDCVTVAAIRSESSHIEELGQYDPIGDNNLRPLTLPRSVQQS